MTNLEQDDHWVCPRMSQDFDLHLTFDLDIGVKAKFGCYIFYPSSEFYLLINKTEFAILETKTLVPVLIQIGNKSLACCRLLSRFRLHEHGWFFFLFVWFYFFVLFSTFVCLFLFLFISFVWVGILISVRFRTFFKIWVAILNLCNILQYNTG